MKYHISSHGRAIADDIAWQPMSTCPLNVEVQLLTKYGVAIRGKVTANSGEYYGWLPFANTKQLLKET